MTRDPLAPGAVVGAHTLEALIGRGGMATVWRASPAQGGPRVALKVLAPERAASPAHAERFVREVRASERLQHPSVVAVRGGGRDGEHLWLAMELLDGEDLSTRARRGALPAREAVAVGRAVTDALSYAHDRGVLHRDVKGTNVFLLRDGGVKLLDFGIARVAGDETMTATGELLGTLTHLAPELCRGERATAASDLYALGVTLFEAVTGRLPFTGNAVSLVMQHARAVPPRARSLAPSLPPALDDLIDRLLAKDPAARPPDARAVRAALDAIPDAGAAPATDSPDVRRICNALAALQADLAERTRALHALEADAGRARGDARDALAALQRAASSWLATGGATEPLTAAEGAWAAARLRVAACDEAARGARAACDDVEFQVRALRGRLAALGAA